MPSPNEESSFMASVRGSVRECGDFVSYNKRYSSGSTFSKTNSQMSPNHVSTEKINNATIGGGGYFSAAEHFADPLKQLDSILQDLIDFKIDAISGAEKAPKMAEILQSSPKLETQMQTVTCAHKFAKNQAARQGMVTCPQLIRELINVLQATHSTSLQEEAALTLQLLAKTATGAKLISQELGIPVLVKMLRHPSEAIYTTALYMLNQLMWHLPTESRPEVRNCSGQIYMSHLLREGRMDDPNWIVICVDAVRMTVYGSSETKLTLLQTSLHTDLIRLLRVYANNPKVTYNIARLIKVLGTCNTNKAKLVQCGAVEALTPLLEFNNEVLQLETLWGLRNISDHAYHLPGTKNLLASLINLLASKDENISICAAGCLCNFTCQNVHNKEILVENGGVKYLCELLNLNSTRQEITEPICSALRHVTHRNPYANVAIYEVRIYQSIPTIAMLLEENNLLSVLPLIKSVVGLVRNLATENESRDQLKYYEITKPLVRILKQMKNIIDKQQAEADSGTVENEENMGCIDGVRLEEMLELCLAALQVMVKDDEIQDELLHTAGFLSLVVELIYSTSQPLQRAAAAFLSQFSTSKSGASAIEREGACPRLTELIQSNNEYIAAYSAAILHRIAKDKPEDYRRRLSVELRQALFDGGLAVQPKSTSVRASKSSNLFFGSSHSTPVHSNSHSASYHSLRRQRREDQTFAPKIRSKSYSREYR